MAEMIENLLIELNLKRKLLTITADNASINETLVSALYLILCTRVTTTDDIVSGNRAIRFQGLDSYIRCLAHILNLTVKEMLSALKSGDSKSEMRHVTNFEIGKGLACTLRWLDFESLLFGLREHLNESRAGRMCVESITCVISLKHMMLVTGGAYQMLDMVLPQISRSRSIFYFKIRFLSSLVKTGGICSRTLSAYKF
jgi:hypothetical protein